MHSSYDRTSMNFETQVNSLKIRSPKVLTLIYFNQSKCPTVFNKLWKCVISVGLVVSRHQVQLLRSVPRSLRSTVDHDRRRHRRRNDVRGRRRGRLSSHDVGPRDPASHRKRFLTHDPVMW